MLKALVKLTVTLCLIISSGTALNAQDKTYKTENVILISLDGMRWQEVFQGIDRRFFDQAKYNKYHYTHDAFKKNSGITTQKKDEK